MFQHVWVESFPAVHARTHLVLRVSGRRTEIGQHRIRIRFLDDQEQELLGGEGTVHFGEPRAGVTEIEAGAVLVFDVPLPRAGLYHFQVDLGQAKTRRIPLSVSQVQHEGSTGGEDGGGDTEDDDDRGERFS